MSKLSIYENSWINLVFEGKNKEYGAYQLRQESDKTTAISFFIGLLLLASMAAIPTIVNLLNGKAAQIALPDEEIILRVTNISPIKPDEPKRSVLPAVKKPEPKAPDVSQPFKPVVAKPIDVDPDAPRTDNRTTSTTTATDGTASSGTATTTTTSGIATGSVSPDSDTKINSTLLLDKLPEYPGGIEKFYQYVGKNFSNPETGEVKTLRVYVSFVIEKDGSMTDIQVKRDPGYGLGKEAIRVLKSLKTKWEPGLIGGKPVRTAYNLPITVQMQ